MNFICGDFETRNTVDIKAGAAKYAKTAEVICFAYSLDGGLTVKHWVPGDQNPEDLFAAIKEGWPFHAHNAYFERSIWPIMVEKFGWPEVKFEQWRCTLSEALAVGLPASLEKVGETLGLAVSKDTAGGRLMKQMAKPRKPTAKDPSVWWERADQIERLTEYCRQDVRAEIAAHDKIRRLSNSELKVYQFDQKINDRGVKFDVEFAAAAIALWEIHCKRINAELHKITAGAVEDANKVAAIKKYSESVGYPMETCNKTSLPKMLQDPNCPETVKELLSGRQQLGLSSLAKYRRILTCADSDDRIRGLFQYHGAGTGRWAGRLVQIQNLPRGNVDKSHVDELVQLIKSQSLDHLYALEDDLGQTLSGLIRSAIVAEEGHRLIVCDFAAVEARGLAWLAEEKWLLKAFREGECVYKGMAASIYGVSPEEVTKDQRFIGKQLILGSGYQMGAKKFKGMLSNTYGVEVSIDFAESVIKAYREKNSNIRRLWWGLNNAFLKCVSMRKPFGYKKVIFYPEGDWVFCRLPSGRDIGYYKPRIVPGKYGEAIEYVGVDDKGKVALISTFGGKLAENVCQAVCRDLLVYSMFRLEEKGYKIIGHVHDEIIAEVPIGFGSSSEVEEIMSETPTWASDFPLKAEGFESRRYRK